MRILIADDQRSFGTALADMVRYCGHNVVAIVGSGLEAIHAFTLHKPDLVLMDYRMPKLNGATACRHILAKSPNARIVLLSAWSPLDGADNSGAMCFLPKPVDLARLNATLLTIAQSVEPPAPELADNIYPFPVADSHLESSKATSAGSSDLSASIPIPQEIISPIEYFPIEISSANADPIPQNDNVNQAPISMAAGVSPAREKLARKSRPRKKRARAR